MKRRIFGVETEYGLTCASTRGDQSPIDADLAARYLFKVLIDSGRSSNVYWRNGGRVYLDVGSHPEYATAECDRVSDLLFQDRAGDRILTEMASAGNEYLANDGIAGKLHLFRNNEDAQGTSFGCHENYLMRRNRHFRDIADALVSFFVTRQILTGAGHIHREGVPRLGYSVRAWHMDDAVSSATTRTRPIINTRDEPLADASEYRRLHVIVGDTNVSESAKALKIVMTDLCLAAIENGVRIADLALADPLSDIRRIDEKVGNNPVLTLKDGREMDTVTLQRQWRERVLNHVDLSTAPALIPAMVDLWGRGLDAVESQDYTPVETELDWAIKHRFLTRACERNGFSLTDPRIARMDLAYHDITDRVVSKMETTGLMKRLTDPREVEEAIQTPPRTTRAHLRGQVVEAAERYHRDVSVDWLHVRLNEAGATGITLSDPFANADERIDNLLEQMSQPSDPTPGVFA